jgi:hypothetical protein
MPNQDLTEDKKSQHTPMMQQCINIEKYRLFM